MAGKPIEKVGGGLNSKYFETDITDNFTVGTTKTYTLSQFNIDVTPKGFAWVFVTGDRNIEPSNMPQYRASNDRVEYTPSVPNNRVWFRGVVFYEV